ncbi:MULTISPECIES: M20/M25/M40 family metallo-hydrolase [Sphingopyxis]|uniref:M20/M25/M40 family metallo-hydrolase n=1 Tax=Sphingopyxis TaxID=165697 RepID=UPI00086A99B0|nr:MULTISPECIES: M20/M25/M40 family metallo-hydrolase [Sphingopyxis]APW73439.1 twin-arginine translocation pathway signal protein [Sphingopyxis granuli]AVA14479.1 twin-arginine translocation pathway signal protein [Sphingopyxis sp. MG]ODU29082.1 MAG: twin-arginine translocation pathway signal protein [Sphingopyxis sp. SCN 67-31]
MDFHATEGWNRRELIRGTAMLGAGAMLMRPLPTLAADGPMAAIRKAAEAGKEASVQRLREWIALPSIAAENRNMPEGAAYMAELAKDAGFTNVEIVPTDGQPGVFGTIDVGAPRTLGIYFMYDVKQFDPAEWTSPPLEGKLVDKPGFGLSMVGRGATNQKGPEATFLAALHAIRAARAKLPVNIVLVCEGEEEIGSPHFRQIATRPNILAALRKCDGIFIPASWQDRNGNVAVNLGSKGVIELELVASGETWGRGPKGDVHSSLKAMVDSPAWRLVAALNTLVTPDGNTPAIEGWFENVRPLTDREKSLIREAAKHLDEAQQKQMLSVQHWIDDLPYEDALIRLAQEPTVNIEGLVAGYTGPGGKTILPGRAVAKLDLRLVPDQTRAEAEKKLRAHLDKHGFGDVEMNVSGGYDPTETDENSRLIRAELATYKRLGVQANINARLAGSWPGATFTAPPVSIPAGHFGIGHGSGAHAPDEYYLIDSTNPKVAGIVDAAIGYAEFLYTLAAIR